MIASGTAEEQDEFIRSLTPAELRGLPYLFDFWALDHQVPPAGDWKTWVILGGRGAGKTRAGAEWVRSRIEGAGPRDKGPARRLALIGETYDQARDIMVFGDSGIIACTPPDRKPKWNASLRLLTWPNGATAQVFSAKDFEALRGPQFDGAWMDEIGCAAIDKGTNQPNKFLDPKSSESSLPKYSNGGRDDLMQLQYLRSVSDFWQMPEANPTSEFYGGPMVDPARIFVWAWDARPYPFFPGNSDVWSDGENYGRGHWLTGRSTSRSLSGVVREICQNAGVPDVDVDQLYGVVRGYAAEPGTGPRGALQSLLLAFSADAVEKNGRLVFRNRSANAPTVLAQNDLAWGEGASLVSFNRAPEAEISGRIRLNYVEAEGDYEVRAVESIFPDEVSVGVAESELTLAITQGEARSTVERWLAEARVARDSVSFAVPPSSELAAGDVVTLDVGSGPGTYRVDRVEDGGLKQIEAVRIEAGLYSSAVMDDTAPMTRPVSVPLPVWTRILDLPLEVGSSNSEAPWVAATAEPWPGPVAVYSSSDGASWRFDAEISRRAVIGLSLNQLEAAVPGLWDRGPALSVRFAYGALASLDEATTFAGGNVAVIHDVASGQSEVFQFREADLVGPDTWSLSMRLRGQLGTDAIMPEAWPEGSTVLVLAQALLQLPYTAGLLETPRIYRIGPASRPVDHGSYVELTHQASGLSLRPYRPTHLRARRLLGGALDVSWIRRTRIDGDGWSLGEVPLGETYEGYRIRVLSDGTLRREVTVTGPNWNYAVSDQAADAVGSSFMIEVAQISDRVGPGYYTRIDING